MKYNRVRCDNCKIDVHRTSNSRHSNCKKHLENFTQNKEIIPRKNSIKRVVEEDNFEHDIDIKDENLYYFTDRILKIAYDINIDNHRDKNAKSQKTITSKFINMGIDKIHINDILKERGRVYPKSINQYKFIYQLPF